MISNTNMAFCSNITKILEDNIVKPIEKKYGSNSWVYWGERNAFPSYVYDLYRRVPTLSALVDACVLYCYGNGITINKQIEGFGDTIKECYKSYFIYGGFAIQVIRSINGNIVKFAPVDFKRIRLNNERTVAYFSNKFDTSEINSNKYDSKITELPIFNGDTTQLSSIYYYSNNAYTVYPQPIYYSALISCEIEKSIDEYHLNNINNGFVGSVIVNVNNGIPEKTQQEEIERNFNEKFTGKENAGRVVISYSDDKEHETTISKIDTEDFSDRYNTLAERSQNNIFMCFKCNPNLLGLSTKNIGFSKEEYAQTYALFNGTMIQPTQNMVIKELKNIIPELEVEIEPIKINFED